MRSVTRRRLEPIRHGSRYGDIPICRDPRVSRARLSPPRFGASKGD